jgi:uncharacterized membrane protein
VGFADLSPFYDAAGRRSDRRCLPAFEQRLADLGISEDFARQAARTLRSGNATLFLLIRQKATDKVLAGLSGAGGMVMRSAFDETKEEALRGALAATRATPS